MRVAQDLYEGIELGDEGAVGLITYMRTDSTRVAESRRRLQAREYLRDAVRQGVSRQTDRSSTATAKAKNAQDAHEAVRPTDPTRRPETCASISAPISSSSTS